MKKLVHKLKVQMAKWVNHGQKKYSKHPKELNIAAVMLLFGLVGSYFLFFSHAAGPFVSFEAEGGNNYAGNLAFGQNQNASEGSFIQFGAPSYPNFKAEYFNNTVLLGSPAFTRNDISVNFDWGLSAPAPNILADYFSVRWTAVQEFSGSGHRFTVTTDDGVRLYIDNVLVIDKWNIQGATTYTYEAFISEGYHSIKMEYFENNGAASASLNIANIGIISPPPPPPTPPPPPPTPPPPPPVGWNYTREPEVPFKLGAYLNTFWNTGSSFTKSEVDVMVRNQPASDGFYYALVLYFPEQPSCAANGCGSYMGIQANTTQGKVVRYSVWGSPNGLPANGATISTFGGEGTGLTIVRPYDWQLDRTYRYSLEYDLQTSQARGGYWWRSYITDVGSGVRTDLGTMQMSAGVTLPYALDTFNERFSGQTSNCHATDSTKVRFSNLNTFYSNGSSAQSFSGTHVQGNMTGCNDTFGVTDLGNGAFESWAGTSYNDFNDPTGHLDAATCNGAWGWARDADYSDAIEVHIYVDGGLVAVIPAGDFRGDVGSHGFNYNWTGGVPKNPGNHTAQAYGINYSFKGWVSGPKNVFLGQSSYGCP